MTVQAELATDEARVRALIDERIAAVRAKDVGGVMSGVAPDVASFDVVNPLRSNGSDASRKRAEAWFSSFDGPIGVEIRDLHVAIAGDVAFCHSLNRYSGTTTAGGRIDMWVRVTLCFRKIDGRWLITHDHNSVPFDASSGKVALDLEP